MADNNLVTMRMVTFKVLDELLNNLKVVTGFSTEWAKEFGKAGRKIGDTLLIRKPQRWLVKSGATYQEQPIVDTYVTATISRHRHIGFDYGAFESTLSLDDMFTRYFSKQTTQLANQVDDEAAQFAYLNTNNINGVLGTPPATIADAQDLFLTAYAILLENGCPTDNLTAVMSPRTAAAVMKYLNQMYNPQGQLGSQVLDGKLMANMFGFRRVSVDQNLYTHTVGTFTGTPTVRTASVNGDTTLALQGWTSGDQMKAGDVLAIASCNNINPKSRRSTGVTKRFCVAADATADGSGNMTVQLAGQMALYDQGQQYGNVDVLPAASASVTVWPGTSSPSAKSGPQSLAFGPNAFGFLPITLPDVGEEGAYCSQATDPDTGTSMTMVRQVNAETYRRIARMDIGFDFAAFWPDNESVRMVA
jgi:hypothetical protein